LKIELEKTRRLFGKTRREITNIRRLLLHSLPAFSSKPSKIGFNSRENRFSIPLAPQFIFFIHLSYRQKEVVLCILQESKRDFLKCPSRQQNSKQKREQTK